MANNFHNLVVAYMEQFSDLVPFFFFNSEEDCMEAIKKAIKSNTPIKENEDLSILN
jgi:hypothetical protein